MKQKCLYCEKEFEAKTDKRKFCSDSCRVMNHRKVGKRNVITKLDVQILFNEFKAAIQGLNMQAERLQKPQEFTSFVNNEVITTSNPKSATVTIKPENYGATQTIRRSYDWYKQARMDCENADDWKDLKEMILSDEFLSDKQKTSLTT